MNDVSVGYGGAWVGAWLDRLLKKINTNTRMANKANRSPPHRITSPPHARLQTPAP
ncbi:hypothetical protein Hanom_Chr01g00075041 [Helianthus anomalus]